MCPRSKVHLVSADQTPAPKSGPSRKSTRLKWGLVLSVEQTPHCNSFLTFEACIGYTLCLHDGKLGQNSIYLHVIRRISLRDYSPPTNIMILSDDRCSFVVRQCLLYRVSHFLQSLPQSTSLAAFTTVFISASHIALPIHIFLNISRFFHLRYITPRTKYSLQSLPSSTPLLGPFQN